MRWFNIDIAELCRSRAHVLILKEVQVEVVRQKKRFGARFAAALCQRRFSLELHIACLEGDHTRTNLARALILQKSMRGTVGSCIRSAKGTGTFSVRCSKLSLKSCSVHARSLAGVRQRKAIVRLPLKLLIQMHKLSFLVQYATTGR